MSLYMGFVYLMVFSTGSLFSLGIYRLVKDLQEIPIKKNTWIDDFDDDDIKKNPIYRMAMKAARFLAQLNVFWNLSTYESVLDKSLDASGRPWDLKASEFLGLKEISAILFGLLGGLLCWIDSELPAPVLVIVVFMIIGFFIPNLIIQRQIKKRHFSLLRDLPFSCDLLSLSVEAGLDFGSALDKVVQNGPPGPLRDELHIVNQETKIGKTRREALSDMMERVQMQEISNFVGSLIQAERMGIGFSSILRIQSVTLRKRRFEQAERKAQQMPVMILLPIIVINLLTLGIILIMPLLGLMKDFGS